MVLNNIFYFDLWDTSFENNFSESNCYLKNFDYTTYQLKNILGDINCIDHWSHQNTQRYPFKFGG